MSSPQILAKNSIKLKETPSEKLYSFSDNHGSGKWLCSKGNYYWRDPFSTSMIMGGSVDCHCHNPFIIS